MLSRVFEEIKQIKALRDLSSTLENARKWMLIGLYVGQRVSDLLALKPSQLRFIENGVYIDINQQKTDKYVTVGVIDKLNKVKFGGIGISVW